MSSGEWCFSQSASASFILVCHFGPEALNFSTTSERMRICISILGSAFVGRPIFFFFFSSLKETSLMFGSSSSFASGSVATAFLISLSSSGVGRIVPGLRVGISLHLMVSGSSQADNTTNIIIYLCENNSINFITKIR